MPKMGLGRSSLFASRFIRFILAGLEVLKERERRKVRRGAIIRDSNK
jgi:hypothetical protein